MTIKLVSDTIDKEDIKKLVDWLSSENIPRLTKGHLTVEFERKWSNKLGIKHTTFVNSGSSAILLSLAALREKGLRNKKVVVPALSWLTDVSSVIQLGMNPILCDCNLTDLSVDLEQLEKIFKKHKPSVFILVPVLGLVPDMEKICNLCEKYGVVLIEDVCESMGSKFKGKNLGTFGKISLFSLYYGHHISTIEGGLICTDDTELHYIITSMRSHGWDRDWPKEVQEKFRNFYNVSEFEALYTFYYPGFNLRATDLQAFLGIHQIDKVDSFSEKRNKNFKKYNKKLEKNLLKLNDSSENFISNFAFPYLTKNRNKVVKALQKEDVEVRPLIAGSMAKKPFWTKTYGQIKMKNADFVNEYGFYLPNHQDLTFKEIEKISDIILENDKE